MTRETTRRGFVTGVVGAGAAGAAVTPAAAQETETDGGGTPTGGGTASGDGTAAGGGTATGDGAATGGGGGGQPDFGDWFEDVGNYNGEVVDLRGEGQPEVQVGTEANGGAFGFGPPAVHVENGATVSWTWTGEGCPHNVVEQEEVFDSGEPGCEEVSPFEHTFEEDGIYRYICEPHLQLGMKGAVVVGTDYPTVDTGGGGGGPGLPTVPDSALSLGVATGFAMAATLGLAYLFIKYGGDYGEFDEA
ncbi:halocyanin-like protein [Halosimplex carlsbadense 2-9-1]|uniref:Halocyanin-like protein n=1 Tax=Halosimplex carlsbadense 2-9-1 TaxID=797114 RepID=M0CRD8_9EURY|nr:halocyanin domain-containing protein [Halosimplex carlsbadense]ELZ25791.1 halocyanin-like protein [Halosimplex carlsbadense 2-9-1]